MTDSGNHSFPNAQDLTDPLPRGEFNLAMESLRREMSDMKKGFSELKTIIQAKNDEDNKVAFSQGERSADLRLLRADVDAIKKLGAGLAVSVGGMALWQIVLLIGRR